MKKIFLSIIGIAVLITTSWVMAADDPILDAIKARKAYMQVVKWNAGPLFGMAKGKLDYDAEFATILATNLEALSQLNNGSMWPDGSDNVSYEGETRALPEIWSTYPNVAEANQAWAQAVTALVPAAGSSLDELREKIGAVGEGCKGCHDDFRAEDE